MNNFDRLNRRKKNISTFCLILCSIFVTEKTVAQQAFHLDTNTTDPDWTTVLGGTAVCSPEETTYGFEILSEGHILNALTNTGTLIWQKAIHGEPEPFLTVTGEDFSYIITEKNKLSLINPGGVVLWTQNCSFDIVSPPFEGRDGRVFVIGKNAAACYGINGICKWKLSLPDKSTLPVQELNDGSLLFFLSKDSDGKTQADRISPYGQILEKIVFTGQVAVVSSCLDGVLLIFRDGSVGLCSTRETEETYTKWSIQRLSNTQVAQVNGAVPTIIEHPGKSLATIIYSTPESMQAFSLDTATGSVKTHFLIPGIKGIPIYKEGTEDFLIVADKTTAVMYNINGKNIWEVELPEAANGKQIWNTICYSQYGYLLLFNTSWTVNAYRVNGSDDDLQIGNATEKKRSTQNSSEYDFFAKPSGEIPADGSFRSDTYFSEIVSDNRSQKIKAGGYAEKEVIWTEELKEAAKEYLASLNEQIAFSQGDTSYFHQHPQVTTKIILQLSTFGTTEFIPIMATLLRTETDQALLHALIIAAKENAFDPKAIILSSLEYCIHRKAVLKNDSLLTDVCDAVYEICRFMGRPAFYNKGKDILGELLQPQYDFYVQNYAGLVLQNFSKLEM